MDASVRPNEGGEELRREIPSLVHLALKKGIINTKDLDLIVNDENGNLNPDDVILARLEVAVDYKQKKINLVRSQLADRAAGDVLNA